MKTNTIHITLALLAAGTACAQEPQGEKGHRPPPPVPPILAIFDSDRDGVISADEIKAASGALAKLDKDGDGQITRQELSPPRPPRPEGENNAAPGDGPRPGHRPPPPVIRALDANKDGTVSAVELKAAPEALLKLDKNSDGELSTKELTAHAPPPPPHREGGPDGEPGGPDGPE